MKFYGVTIVFDSSKAEFSRSEIDTDHAPPNRIVCANGRKTCQAWFSCRAAAERYEEKMKNDTYR